MAITTSAVSTNTITTMDIITTIITILMVTDTATAMMITINITTIIRRKLKMKKSRRICSTMKRATKLSIVTTTATLTDTIIIITNTSKRLTSMLMQLSCTCWETC